MERSRDTLFFFHIIAFCHSSLLFNKSATCFGYCK